MKSKVKEVKTRKRGEKVKFPRISIIDAVNITRKAYHRYGSDIIPYSQFAPILGAKSPKGGSYALKIEALKLYGLMDRYSFKEISVLDKGKMILNAPEEDAKEMMFDNVLDIPIMRKLYERYSKENLPKKRKPIVDYLVSVEGMGKREAGRLTGVFLKDYKIFRPLIPQYIEEIEISPTVPAAHIPLHELKPSSPLEPKIEWLKIIQLRCALSPLSKEEISNLAEQVTRELDNSNNISLKALSNQMKHNINNIETLKFAVNSLMDIISQTYPELVLKYPDMPLKPEVKK